MSHPLKCIPIIIVCLIFSANVFSDVISGFGIFTSSGWDFSEQESVWLLEGDIHIIVVRVTSVNYPLDVMVSATIPPALIIALPDSTFEELRYAPEDTTLYYTSTAIFKDIPYVVRTVEGHYAKFRFIQIPYETPVIEYVYQPDGSRELFDTISVEEFTWGRIKILFK